MNRTLAVIILLSLTLFMITGCGKIGGDDVSLVKNGYLDFDKSITVGQALEGYRYFIKKQWRAYKTDQGRRMVEFRGVVDMSNPENRRNPVSWDKANAVEAAFQFTVNPDKTFSISDLKMYGQLENGNVKESRKIFSDTDEAVVQAIYQNKSFTIAAVFQ